MPKNPKTSKTHKPLRSSGEVLPLPTNPLEEADREITKAMKAAGLTVVERAPTATTEYKVTFPRGSGSRLTIESDLGQSDDSRIGQSAPSEIVELEVACKVLVKSRAVRARIKRAVGQEKFEEALTMMRAGNLEGDLGEEIHELLTDVIGNEFKNVWLGVIHRSHEDYAMGVREYHGVYVAWALEFSPVGYFLDKDSAIRYANVTWNSD